jgi:hypothetical protein
MHDEMSDAHAYEIKMQLVGAKHLGCYIVGAIIILVELIDHESGVTIHLEAFNAELDSYSETMKCHLIFSGIIGCSEV